ncbi:MAG: hypothetical protein PHU27_09670, partial [Salinivirgaceae bacterium]|nr:hypothetical protein [Salinivirgaceae bacterium]
MRIIPKNTKIKLQFYKGVTITDVIIAVVGLAFLSLAVTSNFHQKWIIAMAILVVVAPLYIPLGEMKLYNALGYALKFLFAKKSFSKKKKGKVNIGAIVPYEKIQDNLIRQKENGFTGIIEIKPIEFNLLSEYKQNYFIDGLFSNILKNIGVYQELDIIKLERPIIFDDYIKNELTRVQNIIRANENGDLSEAEFRARATVLEDRINIIDKINSEEKIFTSSYYLAVHDIDKKSLQNVLDLIQAMLKNNNLEAKQLNDKQLALFI